MTREQRIRTIYEFIWRRVPRKKAEEAFGINLDELHLWNWRGALVGTTGFSPDEMDSFLRQNEGVLSSEVLEDVRTAISTIILEISDL